MDKNTVTLSLEVYEEMKRKIERLEEEVKQKTIIKYSAHRSVEMIVAVILFFGFIFLISKLYP